MRHKITFDKFKERVINKFGNNKVDLSLIDKSTFCYTHIQKFRCIEHDFIFERLPKQLLRHKHICPLCYKQYRSKPIINNYSKTYLTKEQFLSLIKEKFNNKIKINKRTIKFNSAHTHNKHINLKGEITAICSVHGEFQTKPRSLLRSTHGCEKCAKEFAKQQMIKQGEERRKTFINDAIKIHGNQYDYSKVDISGSLKKVEIICPEHGSFFMYPSNHLVKQEGCPKCNKQCLNAERRLGVLLKEKFPDIKIVPQYHGFLKKQSLDYFMPDYNIGIEYQGEQHFENVDYFNDNRHNFEKRKLLDINKYNTCLQHNVKILYFTFKQKFKDIQYIDKVYTNLDELFLTIQELIKNKN